MITDSIRIRPCTLLLVACISSSLTLIWVTYNHETNTYCPSDVIESEQIKNTAISKVQTTTDHLPLCTDGDIMGHWNFSSNVWIPSGCSYNTTYHHDDQLFAECLIQNNITNVVFFGDSVLRKIMERIRNIYTKQIWKQIIYFQNYSFHQLKYRNHTMYFQYVEWHYVDSMEAKKTFEHILNNEKPDVLMLNAGLWDLRYPQGFNHSIATKKDKIPFPSGYDRLSEYFGRLGEYTLSPSELKKKIIWKTISAVMPEFYKLRSERLSELRQMNMNIFATKLAKEHEFLILDDYIISKPRPDDYCCQNRYYQNIWGDIGDPIHYMHDSYTMDTVITIFKHLVCL